MRLMRTLSTTVLAAALVVGCNDSTDPDPGNVSQDDLAGVWTATQFLLTSTDDPAMSVDMIALGATFTLTINADGTYSEAGLFPGNPPEVENGSGTYVIQGTNIILTETDDPEPFTVAFVLSGNTLTLTSTDETFDFDDDGVEDAATLEMILTRS